MTKENILDRIKTLKEHYNSGFGIDWDSLEYLFDDIEDFLALSCAECEAEIKTPVQIVYCDECVDEMCNLSE